MSGELVMVIEGDPAVRAMLRTALKAAGFARADFAGSGDAGLEAVLRRKPAIVLLDSALPGLDGLSVCRAIRSSPSARSVPVVILSDMAGEADVVRGLEAGADDYVTKPFSPQVLMARLRAILRRPRELAQDSPAFAGLSLDPDRRTASHGGNAVALTKTEYGVLSLLVSRPGRVYTRSQIIDAVQGDDKAVTDRSVDVQLVGLRRKLGSWARHIESVRGVGYRLCEKPGDGQVSRLP